MKKALAAVVAALVLAGTAVAAVPVAERWLAGEIRGALENDGVTRVEAVSVDLLERRIAVTGLATRSGLDLRIGRVEATGLAWPLGELLRGRFPLAGLQWGDPLTVRRLEIEKLKLASHSFELQWDVDRLALDGLSVARHEPATGPRVTPVNRVARALLATTLARASIDNARGSVPLSGGRAGSVAGVTVEGYDRGRADTVKLVGLSGVGFDREPPPVTVAEVVVRQATARSFLAALASETVFGLAGRLSADSLKATGFGGDLMRRYGISVAGVGFETSRDGERRSRVRLAIDDVVLAPPLSGLQGLALRMALQAMGLSQAKAGFACTISEDRDRGEIAVDDCAVQAPGLATVRFAARVVDGDAALWQSLDDGDLLLLSDTHAGLASARLVVADQSLLERSARAAAAMGRQPLTPAIRAGWAREVRRFQPTGVLISQAMTQVLDTVARFVEQGGTLTLEAKPDRPVGLDRLDYLLSPGADLVTTLGLTATLAK